MCFQMMGLTKLEVDKRNKSLVKNEILQNFGPKGKRLLVFYFGQRFYGRGL